MCRDRPIADSWPGATASCSAAWVTGCPYVLVPEVGHISNLEHPEFFTTAFLEFLAARTGSNL
jgi:pimeloyl-ACP methyl ester carboxylesterase